MNEFELAKKKWNEKLKKSKSKLRPRITELKNQGYKVGKWLHLSYGLIVRYFSKNGENIYLQCLGLDRTYLFKVSQKDL